MLLVKPGSFYHVLHPNAKNIHIFILLEHLGVLSVMKKEVNFA